MDDDLGLRCGIEIHQQLATKKLFCDCPSEIREDKPDFEIVRRLRASAGESGETDQAALHETFKEKQFQYRGYADTTCLVEIDEEPPHPLNPAALRVGVQVAKMMGSTLLPRAQVMRKTVIDGSNTAGFQRTMLFAMGGEISGPWGSAGVQTVCLEEDSAKIVQRAQEYDVYNLSRLGIPLIEVATDPDLTTPEMVREAAAHIGLLLRSTRAVRRGLGTIRQDINVSIREGARVEMKGAQDLKMIPVLVKNEMLRQHGLVQLRDCKIRPGTPVDVTPHFVGAKGFIASLLKKGAAVIGVPLPGAAGVLGRELYPGYRVGTELAGYAKANGFGGIIHADEDPKKYGVDFGEVTKAFGLGSKDSWLVLVGDPQRITAVLRHVLVPRIRNFSHVPMEVRKANPDGTTTFMRPMPGAARMYPETDIPDVVIDSHVPVPKLLTEQYADFAKKYSLPIALAKEAIEIPDFERLAEVFKERIPPAVIADALVVYPKEISRREHKELSEEMLSLHLEKILEAYANGVIPKEAIYLLLVDVAYGKDLDIDRFSSMDENEVERVIKEIIAADPDAPINALMGQAMAKLRGKADGKLIMQLLRKNI